MAIRQYILLLILSLIFIFGCAEKLTTDDQNAPDASGEYVSGKDSRFGIKDMAVSIRNEDGRHDIWVEVERVGLTNAEKKMYVEMGVSLADAENIISSIELGKGLRSWENARPPIGKDDRTLDNAQGDNVSRDKGATSEIYVCSEIFYLSSAKVHVDFCLLGKWVKEKGSLQGRLETHLVRDDGFGNPTGESISLVEKFGAKREGLFFDDLFGAWSGNLVLDADAKASLKKILPIQIVKAAGFVIVNPKADVFTYSGRSFHYEQNKKTIEDTIGEGVPSFELRFSSPWEDETGKDYQDIISLSGQVFTREQFAGSIFFMDHGVLKKLGSFQFQKQE